MNNANTWEWNGGLRINRSLKSPKSGKMILGTVWYAPETDMWSWYCSSNVADQYGGGVVMTMASAIEQVSAYMEMIGEQDEGGQ